MIRVILVDDHVAFLRPLAFVLEREPDLTVVAQVASLAEARRQLTTGLGADVALVDIDLPDGSGIDLIRALRAANPSAAALILSGTVDARTRALAIAAGACGVLHKSTAEPAEIAAAVRLVRAGEPLISPAEAVALTAEAVRLRERERAAWAALEDLTPREREVLQALAYGLSDKQIADRLYVSPKTVRNHVVNLLGKLGVDSRLQALVLAVRHGLVAID
jgi:RNA polymerase sigma factor (sigma-70 family)